MNSTVTSYISFAFAVILTMLALAYTFWEMTRWPETFELVPSAATVFMEQTDIPKEVPWTGTQVVAKLYQLSEDLIPIVVDGFTFGTEEDVLNHSHRVPLTNRYTSEVTINDSGNVILITFSKKGG